MTDNSTYTEWRMENLLFCCFAFELCVVIHFLGQMLRFFSISRFSEGSVHSTSIVTNLKKTKDFAFFSQLKYNGVQTLHECFETN